MSKLNLPPPDLSDLLADIALRRLFAMSRVLWFRRYADHEYGLASNGIFSQTCCIGDLQRAGYRHDTDDVWRKQ